MYKYGKILLLAALTIAMVGGSAVTGLTPVFAAPANVIVNSGFETVGTGTSTAANWTTYQNGYTRTNEAAHSGTWSLKATNANTSVQAGAYQRVDLNQTTVQPVFIGGYIKGSNITMAAGSNFGASLYAEIYLNDGTVMYWNSVPNKGTFDWRWVGFNTGSGFTTTSNTIQVTKPISYILVVPIIASASGTAYFDDISVQQYPSTLSAVTLMFDDGNTSDLTVGYAQMGQFNMPGTSAIISGQIDQAGHLTTAQMQTLKNAGWEMVSHTVSHPDLTTLTAAQVDAELKNSQATIVSKGFTAASVAVPFGAYNADIIGNASQYYNSLRTFEDGYNPQGVFPYQVKVQKVINTTTVAQVQSWLNQAKANNQWLVLVFHSLNATGDDIYHTDPTVFSQMIQAVNQSNLQVITYGQGITTFGVNGTGVLPPKPTPAAPTVTFTASPNPVVSNTTSKLTWSTTNANTCLASGAWSGAKATSGTASTSNITSTQTFNLACNGAGGTTTKSVTITVATTTGTTTPALPTVTFTASPNPVVNNTTSKLTWSSTNANSCLASGAWSGAKATSGTASTSNITSTQTFNLACNGAGGTTTKSVTITVASTTGTTTPPVPGSWSSSGTATSGNVGSPVNLSITVRNSGQVTNAITDIEIYNSSGSKVYQKYYTGQTITASAPAPYQFSWTPTTAGTYTVKVGVFNSNWSTNYYWVNSLLTFSVGSGTTNPPTSGVVNVINPVNNSVVSGTQLFKAALSGAALSSYNMYWQVDNGTLNLMSNGTDVKQAYVSVTNWTWRGTGPYIVNFVAKDLSGNLLGQKSVSITK